MNSLVGLVKKDLLISRFLFIVWFAINILFMIGSFFCLNTCMNLWCQ
ncbi:hypothetical protein MHI39_09070 [Heyndrickxia sp. FSL K6-6286]